MVIVAAVDRSDRAHRVCTEAVALAEAFDEPLHVVHVMSESDFIDLQVESSTKHYEAVEMDEVLALAEEEAEAAAEGIDYPFESVGRMGRISDEVVRYADEHDARYVVVGGRKRSPTGKAVFGSATQSILLEADCPVVAVIT